MKLHEINNTSLTPEQIEWLDLAIFGTYKVVDGKINVKGQVNIPTTTELLPVQFGKVTGCFDCAGTKITSLEGCPSQVDEYFSCSDTKITSLEGGPSRVGGSYFCDHAKITSLKGCPSKIGGNFYCHNTQITSLIGVADIITKINGKFFTDWYKIKGGGLGLVLIDGLKGLSLTSKPTDPFKIISKYIGKPDLIFDCQAELIEAGFEEYAQL